MEFQFWEQAVNMKFSFYRNCIDELFQSLIFISVVAINKAQKSQDTPNGEEQKKKRKQKHLNYCTCRANEESHSQYTPKNHLEIRSHTTLKANE